MNAIDDATDSAQEGPGEGRDEGLGGHQFGGHQFGGHQFGGSMFGGWLGDLPDGRDQPLFPPVGRALPGGEEPPALDVRVPEPPEDGHLLDWHVPVLQQEPLQSCVSCAVTSVVRHLDAAGSRPLVDPGPSPLFLYYNTRLLEGTGRCDVGTSIRAALKALNRHGVCQDDAWGKGRQVVERPATQAYENALYAGTVSYRRVYRLGQEPDRLDLTPVRRALANDLPVVFGFSVYDSFRRAATGGEVPLPGAHERVLFGHACVLIGYDATGFTAVNSWGPEWGRSGRFRLPAEYLADRRLAKDFWVITSLGPSAAPGPVGRDAPTTAA